MDTLVPNATDSARRDAIATLANLAKTEAQLHGVPSKNPIVETVGRRVETQAVSLLLEAAQTLMFRGTPEWRLLEELRKVWRAPYTDHEAKAEYWREIWELADRTEQAEFAEFEESI